MQSPRQTVHKWLYVIGLALWLAGNFGLNAFAATEYNCEAGIHEYTVTITKPATSDENGELTYTCDLCGVTYTEMIPATGHRYGDWVVDVPATCTAAGKKHRVCEVCGCLATAAIPVIGHSYIHSTIEPTCTQPGEKRQECRICGAVVRQPIPALGHLYGEWIISREPTANEDGLAYRLCIRDGCQQVEESKEEKPIPKLDVNPSPQISPDLTDQPPAESPSNRPNVLDGVLSGLILSYLTLTFVVLWYNGLVINADKIDYEKFKKQKEALL